MRRLILEFPVKELKKTGSRNLDLPELEKVKTLETLQPLKRDQEEIAAIVRIEIEHNIANIEEFIRLFLGDTNAKVQLLDREKDGAYIVFVKHKWDSPPFTAEMLKAGGYAISREVNEGKMKLAILGSVKQLRCALENFKKAKVHFKVLSLTDARFASDSPLNALTEKQRRVLTAAYKLGYYDLPRRIDSEKLAKKLDVKRATLVVHRRKAEKRVFSKMFSEPMK